MSIALTILSFLLLFAPLIWELVTDANGDYNKKADVFVRLLITALVSLPGYFLVGKNVFIAFFLSLAIHFLFFDYLINIILYKNGVINNANWFSNTGKKGLIDNISIWKRLNPWWKLTVRLLVLVGALIIYFR